MTTDTSDLSASRTAAANDTLAAVTARDTSALPPHLKCSYRSKPCSSIRATKLNGDFHKLCEYHRRRANLNQQRVHQRRKLNNLNQEQGNSGNDTARGGDLWYDDVFDYEGDDIDMLEPSPSPCGDLPLQDLQILEILLADTTRHQANTMQLTY